MAQAGPGAGGICVGIREPRTRVGSGAVGGGADGSPPAEAFPPGGPGAWWGQRPGRGPGKPLAGREAGRGALGSPLTAPWFSPACNPSTNCVLEQDRPLTTTKVLKILPGLLIAKFVVRLSKPNFSASFYVTGFVACLPRWCLRARRSLHRAASFGNSEPPGGPLLGRPSPGAQALLERGP